MRSALAWKSTPRSVNATPVSITAATTRVAGACVDVPCLRHVEDSQVPLLGEVRIVRHEQRLPQVGRLRVLDVRPRDERPRHRLGIGLRLQRQHVGAGQIKRGRVTARTPSARRCRAADSGTAAGRNLTMTSPGTYCGCAAERSDSRAFLLGRRRVPTRVALGAMARRLEPALCVPEHGAGRFRPRAPWHLVRGSQQRVLLHPL